MSTILEQQKKVAHPQPEPQQEKDDRELVVNMSHAKKSFGKKTVLQDVNMKLRKGENLVVLGKSGQGKSVNIKLIVGMLTQDSGSVKVFGKEVKDLNTDQLKDLRIRIGFLFQSGALFDSMTVRENLSFPSPEF